jgi:hypothetical protein
VVFLFIKVGAVPRVEPSIAASTVAERLKLPACQMNGRHGTLPSSFLGAVGTLDIGQRISEISRRLFVSHRNKAGSVHSVPHPRPA